MKKMYGKLLSFVLALSMMISAGATTTFAADATTDVKKNDIVILYENDAHCEVDGYEALAAIKEEMSEKARYVSLVSCGDFSQGGVIGSISKGENIIKIMNQIGYEVVTLGNHEFDYQIPQLKKLMKELNAQVTSTNFVKDSTGKPLYNSYAVKYYGKKKIAFVGVTTPETFTKSTPTYFQNSKGEFIYNFCGDKSGKKLYKRVQDTVNAARKNGADYVVVLAHLGTEGVEEQYSSQALVKNTYGIDVVLDGHSHSVVPAMEVKNAKDENIIISSTGTKLSNVGQLIISEDGTISTKLISTSEKEYKCSYIKEYVEKIKEENKAVLGKVLGKTKVDLTTLGADGKRAVRNAETNLGDLCADASRYVLDADFAIMNGGGIRANIAAGDITYNDLLSVYPWGNMGCVVEVTGQQMKDALEMGAKNYPDENGGFLQVSGLKYTIDAAVPSSVVVDEKGMFQKVDGAYRVKDIKVWNKKTSKYEKLDLKKTYQLAGINYTIKSCGDGFSMFSGCKVIKDDVMIDNQVLYTYITEVLNGVVGNDYKDPAGQGRITIINKDEVKK
ncbi:MAG: 5'-nucleotidase C-terminal domain-containing protein [bacterium]|nr:5'-nucleotidase C-terminal domain-containing protein [bacterium]